MCVLQQPFQLPNFPNLQGSCGCSSDSNTKQKDTGDYPKVHRTPPASFAFRNEHFGETLFSWPMISEFAVEPFPCGLQHNRERFQKSDHT